MELKRMYILYIYIYIYRIKDTFKSLTTTDEEGMYVEGSICEEAMQGFYFAFVLSKTFGVMVTLINVIFKQIVMRGIGVAKSTTVSHESQSIMLWLFIVQFFNTGLLLLLVSADLSQIWAPLQNVFHGQYPDFTLEWYQELGTLISNVMMIMIFTPFIEFAIAVCIYIYIYIYNNVVWNENGIQVHG